MVQPRGRPLINCNLFGSQFIRAVMSLRRELMAYEEEHGRSENIVSIRIRPSRDRGTEMGRLLDAQGNAPLLNLRRVHRVAGGVIQGAFEYMESQGWLVQFAIGRHWDPVEGGVAFDWHAHVTAEMVPECSALVAAYLHKKFDRVWISSEDEPGIRRDLVATACYPAAKIANRGWEDIADENLLEFFRQTAGLRRIEVAGPIRAARQAKRRTQPSVVSGDRGPAAELAAIVAEAAEMLPDALNANEMLPSDADGDEGSATPTGAAAEEKPPRAARLLRCHFAYFDLTLRWVARVSDYAGWYDLRDRYDLSLDIADAKALAARAAHLLSLNPATPESQTDESLEFESLVEWGPLAAGTGRPTAEPQRDRGPKAASGDETAGSTPAAAGTGTGTPTAEPQRDRGPKAASGDETAGSTPAAAGTGTGTPTAEPQRDRGPKAASGDETAGSTPAAAGTGTGTPTAEPQRDRGPKAASGDETAGSTPAAAGTGTPTAEPQRDRGPKAASGDETAGSTPAAAGTGTGTPTAEPQRDRGPKAASGDETAGSTPAAAGTGTPTAEPQRDRGPKAASGDETAGSTPAAAGTGTPTAEPQRDRGPKAASGDETAGSTPAAAGTGTPTAEPQRDRGPKAASGDETAGSTPAAAGTGTPTAEPQRDRGPKAASGDETAGSTPAAAGTGTPTAEPQRDRGPKAASGDETAGSTPAAAGTGTPTAEPQRDRGPKAASGDETAGSTPAAAGTGTPTAEPQRDRGPKAASGDETAGSTPAAAGTGRPTAEPQRDRGPKAASGDAGGARARGAHPTTPENPATLPQNSHLAEPITPTRLNVDDTEVFTLELVVRSEGPATVTAKVSMPTRFMGSVGHTVTTLPPPP